MKIKQTDGNIDLEPECEMDVFNLGQIFQKAGEGVRIDFVMSEEPERTPVIGGIRESKIARLSLDINRAVSLMVG